MGVGGLIFGGVEGGSVLHWQKYKDSPCLFSAVMV